MSKDEFLEIFYIPESIWICIGAKIGNGKSLTAWVTLPDMTIRHSVNGTTSEITFTTMDSFASYIEGLTEPKSKEP